MNIEEIVKDKNVLINSIDSVITRISNFYIDIDISGTTGEYFTSIESNFDNIVDDAVRNIVKNEANKVNHTIKRSIDDKTEKLIKDIEFEITQLALKIDTIDKILDEANKLLKVLP